jgi:hypothetical protein
MSAWTLSTFGPDMTDDATAETLHDAPRRTSKVATALTVVVLLALAVLLVGPFISASWQSAKERSHSFALLAEAANMAELTDAVGRLGIVFMLNGGDWIAVRYRDSHGWPGFSSSVALASNGVWLESDHHFCGALSIYRDARDRALHAEDEEVRALYREALDRGHLRAIEEAASVETAIEILLTMHFRQSNDARPAAMIPSRR